MCFQTNARKSGKLEVMELILSTARNLMWIRMIYVSFYFDTYNLFDITCELKVSELESLQPKWLSSRMRRVSAESVPSGTQ